jgi:uncharacterized membrane protein
MEMESVVQLMIVVHASLGGLALLAGTLALVFKKGSAYHKRAGIIFYYGMLASAVVALGVSLLPNHEIVFLFVVGLFSLYFILTGYRALRFKKDNPDLKVDKIVAWGMIVTAIVMVFYPVLVHSKFNLILGTFALVGSSFAIRDLRSFKNPEGLKKNWLTQHLGKMMGGYISATTAFVVVNSIIPSVWGWFVPGILGTFYIVYWSRKVSPKKARSN